jgi:hypothetical protein
MLDEQSRQKSRPQGHSSLSPLSSPIPELTLEDTSPKWASRLNNENIPTFMSLTWLQWRFELQRSSKCVVGEAYGYSSEYTENCDECDRIGCKFPHLLNSKSFFCLAARSAMISFALGLLGVTLTILFWISSI